MVSKMREFLWRMQYMWIFRKATFFEWSFCWHAAMAAEYEEALGYTPSESVYEELSYWDGD